MVPGNPVRAQEFYNGGGSPARQRDESRPLALSKCASWAALPGNLIEVVVRWSAGRGMDT